MNNFKINPTSEKKRIYHSKPPTEHREKNLYSERQDSAKGGHYA